VRARVLAGEVNTAPPAPGRTVRQILRANLFTRFNAILGSLFAVVLVIGPLQDALFGIVLAANTGIGIVQELRAKRTLDRLAILTAARARVVRDGTTAELPVAEVVLDDVLEMHPGDQAVVDAVVLRSEGLELDEALLSGEAAPVEKQPGDRVLSGSFVVAGAGRVRATSVGGAAYAARLQAQARRFSLIRSELQQGTNWILRMVTWIMAPAGLLLVLSQLLRSHQPLADALRGSVAGVGAMVPEGLVLLTSIAFAVGALRLARRRVLVQELAAIEGLARVDVLCIDKTGTLTAPGMQLVEIEPLADRPVAEIEEAIGAIAAADPAPNATVRALAARGRPAAGWNIAAQVPFSSARKWSAVTFAARGTWVMGAPGIIGRGLPASAAAAIAGHESAGRRVLLLGVATGPADSGAPPDGLTAVALLVLAERIRDDAAATVRYLLDQGITIKVLSGDAPPTVAAIADRVGIPAPGGWRDASELADDEASVGSALQAASVLGRVRPGQKLAAVRALQAAGHVVAMVGDGVNDVQALKQADLGIAMGSGSQSSRSVARIVLLDSAFSAIPQVLAEGRRVIANIERVARLFVTKTVYAAALAVAIGLAGVPFPFFPRHLTIVGTLTIGIPGFFLALAAGAPRARPGFTRRVVAFTVPAGVAAAAATLVSYAIARAAPGITTVQSRTAAVLALLAVSLWVLTLIARPLNAARITLIAGMASGLGLLFAFPFSRRTFSLQPPPVRITLVTLGVVIVTIAALTLWRMRSGRPPQARGVRAR
jgi:cation-transporting ATPase E